MQNNSQRIKKLWILLALLTTGFSSIWLLPEQGAIVTSCLNHELPGSLEGWSSEKRRVSEIELKVLADDTEFARRVYYKPEMPNSSQVEVSVVFSGKDINNSLHRPEVCLRAQGWNFVRERSIDIRGVLPNGGDLPVREIVCIYPRKTKEGAPVLNSKGEPTYWKRIQYYTFFGAYRIVSGHYDRTFEDIKGRLFGGYDQQWAYATFSVGVDNTIENQTAEEAVYEEEQRTALLKEFITGFLPEVLEEKL